MRKVHRYVAVVAATVALSVALGGANAAPCPNPNALGVSRVMQVSARDMPLIGSHDYGVTLPLAPGEVVLTFDDGPLSPYTNHVLKALADECLQALFFMVGRQASANRQLVWQIRAAGHTIGTHTQNHPLHRMSPERAAYEIDTGIASVGAALGGPRALAPFFRFPGLFRTTEAEHHLRARGLMSWSVDVDSYDWKRISAGHMLHHTLEKLEARRGGILLMHDVQAKTALVLPNLLSELKARGYRIVHVVPSGAYPLENFVASASPPPQIRLPVAASVTELPLTASRRHGPTIPASAPPPPHINPGGNGLFEAIFTSSVHRWGR
jgi:peptidoglycan/xylan/chitin deacetylase (PgdA/CDA1 family)